MTRAADGGATPSRAGDVGTFARGDIGVERDTSSNRRSLSSSRRRVAVRTCPTGSPRADALRFLANQVVSIRRRARSRVLRGVTLSLEPGESASIMGASGSGKSTLLYMIGGLDTPTSGEVTLDGVNPHKLSPRELAALSQHARRLRLPGSLPAAAVLGARERAGADAS